MKKKLYLNENHFHSFLGRMENKNNYDDSRLIIKKLLTEGRNKVAGAIDTFKKTVDDAVEAMYKGVEIPTSTKKVLTDLGENISGLGRSFQPMESFKYGGIGKNSLNFIVDVSENLKGTIKTLENLIKELPSLGGKATKVIEGLKRYDNSLNTIYHLDSILKKEKDVTAALLDTLIKKKNTLGGSQRLIDDLDLLTVPDKVTGEIDELGKYWKEIKYNTELGNTDDVLKYIDDTFERFGFNMKKFKKGVKSFEKLKLKSQELGFDVNTDILVKMGDDFGIVKVKDFDKLSPKQQSLLKKNLLSQMNGVEQPSFQDMIKGMTEAIDNSKIGTKVKFMIVSNVVMAIPYALGILWGVGSLINAVIQCVFEDTKYDVFKDHEKKITKKGAEVLEDGYWHCVGVRFTKTFLSPINYLTEIVQDNFQQLWTNILGMTEGEVENICKEMSGEKMDCDCEEVSKKFVNDNDNIIKLKKSLEELKSLINKETDREKREQYLQILKNALKTEELPSFIFKDGQLQMDFKELAKTTCILLSIDNQIKDANQIIKKWTQDYLQNLDLCDKEVVAILANETLALYNYAKRGIIFTNGNFKKNLVYKGLPDDVKIGLPTTGIEVVAPGNITKGIGADKNASEALKLQFQFWKELHSDLSNAKKKKVLCDEIVTKEDVIEEIILTPIDIVLEQYKDDNARWDLQGDQLCKIDIKNPDKHYNRFIQKLDYVSGGTIKGSDPQYIELRNKWWDRQLKNKKENCKKEK